MQYNVIAIPWLAFNNVIVIKLPTNTWLEAPSEDGRVWLGRCLALAEREMPTRLWCLLCTSCSTCAHIITFRSPNPVAKNCSFVTGGLYANISRKTCQHTQSGNMTTSVVLLFFVILLFLECYHVCLQLFILCYEHTMVNSRSSKY